MSLQHLQARREAEAALLLAAEGEPSGVRKRKYGDKKRWHAHGWKGYARKRKASEYQRRRQDRRKP